VRGENLVAVLAEGRRGDRRRPRRAGEFDRLRHRPVPVDHRVVERLHQILFDNLQVVEDVLDRPHRRAGHALAAVRR